MQSRAVRRERGGMGSQEERRLRNRESKYAFVRLTEAITKGEVIQGG